MLEPPEARSVGLIHAVAPLRSWIIRSICNMPKGLKKGLQPATFSAKWSGFFQVKLTPEPSQWFHQLKRIDSISPSRWNWRCGRWMESLVSWRWISLSISTLWLQKWPSWRSLIRRCGRDCGNQEFGLAKRTWWEWGFYTYLIPRVASWKVLGLQVPRLGEWEQNDIVFIIITFTSTITIITILLLLLIIIITIKHGSKLERLIKHNISPLQQKLTPSPTLRLAGVCKARPWWSTITSGMSGARRIKIIDYCRWWFPNIFIFTPSWGRFPYWLIFFRWVETTNQ